MVVLLELCYVSALLSIEHNGLYESVDPRSLELLRQVVYQKRPVLLRVRDANFATAAYDTLNAALSRQNFQVAKIAVAIWDKSGIQMNDASKRALGLSQSYQCRDIIEIANKPIIIVHYDTVSGMTPTRMPLFAYIDCRLMLTGFFTRKDLEDEFHFATCFMKKKTSRTRDELMAIAGLGMIKRSGDSMSSDDECSPEKRLKVDDSDYMIDFESIRKPPRVLLSSEAFGVFQGKRGFDFRNLTPSKTCARLSETLSLEPESLDMKYLHKYYNTTCTHNEELDTRENYFLLVTPVGFNQIACAFELASTLSHQIQSQFSINIVDDAELNLNLTGQNFALLKKNDFDMSPIMNTLSDAHAVEYIDRKNQLALEDPKTAKIDIGEVSISGSSSRIEPVEPNVPWPIELNIPQLGPNAVTVEIVIPNDKRRRFEFGGMNDANGLKAVRLAVASTRTQSPSPKTIVVSFGLSGAQSGLYDLRKTMKMGDAEFTHLIVVRKNDVNKYREYWPNSCLLVMGAEFDNHGIGCMKLFALRLLQHSWALSPPDCWPFVFFLSDQVAQFRSWSNESRSWDPIPLHDVLLDLESQIASSETDVAMLGLRPWTTADGPPPEDRQFSNRLVQGCYMLNLKYNNISMDHSKYEGEDIDFCLRQVAAGNSCIVLENYGYVEKHNPRSKVLPFEISVPVSRYVTTEEDSENIKAPGFYLLNEYFKHEGKSIFTDASGTNPVLISGKYINFGKQVPVQILGVSPCQSRPFSGLVICELQPVASSVPTQQELSALSFVPQAKIVVVAADSGRLRQSIRKFGLDKEWEFSLLHEFATANETHAKLYFITGMRRP